MEQFITITRKFLDFKLKNRYLDLAVYAVLKSCKTDNISHISYNKISKRLGISKSYIKIALDELTENNLVYINKVQGKEYDFNEYKFNKDFEVSVEYIRYSVFEEPLKAKELGILLYLKLISEGNWLDFKNFSELGNILGMSRQTAAKYIKGFNKYLEPSKVCGYRFINPNFTVSNYTDLNKKTNNTNTIQL